MQDPAEVCAYGMRGAGIFIVQVLGKRQRFNLATYACFFVSFTCGSNSSRGITIYSTFGKRPSPGTSAHQKEFDFAICLPAITHRSDHRPSAGLPGREILLFREINQG